MFILDQTGCLTVTWEIENFALLMSAEGCILTSPPLEESSNWALTINPSPPDVWFKLRNFTSYSSYDHCEMAFVSSTGQETPLQSRSLTLFKMGRYMMIRGKAEDIISQGTLAFRCRIRQSPFETRERNLKSVLERVDYLWKFNSSKFNKGVFLKRENVRLYITQDKMSGNGVHTIVVRGAPAKSGCLVEFVYFKLFVKSEGGYVAQKELNAGKDSYRCEIVTGPSHDINLQLQLECIVALEEEFREISHIATTKREKLHVQYSNNKTDAFKKQFSECTHTMHIFVSTLFKLIFTFFVLLYTIVMTMFKLVILCYSLENLIILLFACIVLATMYLTGTFEILYGKFKVLMPQ